MTDQSLTTEHPEARDHRMECMELWGGTTETNTTVSMTGLTGNIRSQAYGGGLVGGDVYYFTSCASGRISRVLLADVTGHGEAVAKTGTALRDVMRRNVNVIRQQALMTAIHAEFGQITQAGGFATAVVVTHFAPTRTMTISVAGHPPPLFYSSAAEKWSLLTVENGEHEETQLQDIPLGITEGVDFTSTSLAVGPGDILLLYTDAFSESRDADGKLVAPDGLVDILNQRQVADRQAIIPTLVDQLRSTAEQNLLDDDATIIALEPTGRRIPMRDNLLAPWRMLRGVDDRHAS